MNKRGLFYYSFLYLILCVCIVAQGALVNRYSFMDGDTTAVDSVSGRDGTLEGTATIAGNQLVLDGSGYVNLPGDILHPGRVSVTIETWFEINSTSAWQRVFDFGETSGNYGGNCIFYTPTSGPGDSRFVIGTNGVPSWQTGEDMVTAPIIAVGTPTHIACVYDGTASEIRLYQDGALVGATPTTMQLSGVARMFAYIGDSVYPADPLLRGSVDEFRIYDEPLGESVIAQHYIDGPDAIGPSPVIIKETNGSTEVTEGDIATDEYTVVLASQPQDTVTLTVDPDEQLDVGNGRDNPIDIVFDTENWDSERTVEVRAFDDDVSETEPHIGLISHSISSNDPNFNDISLPSVHVTVRENECGAWGYNYADLSYDCEVTFEDFAIFASDWLNPLNPVTLETLASEWLKTTQPYAAGAAPGPVQDSTEPLFIEPDEVICEIDEKVYGHFLEHIYHSVNGGLWGELVWNRSLEQWSGGIPLHWTDYGSGSFSSNNSALNSDYCLQIGAGGSETGIEQSPFFIENGLTYYGSLWARSTTAPSSLVVRLKNGSTTIEEQPISVTSSSWVEYPFTFTPSESAEDGTLQIGVTGTETVYLDQISMMGQDSNAIGGYRPDLYQAVEDIGPPVIRWPGGYFAEFYRWKDGIGSQHQRVKYPIVAWDDLEVNAYGTDEFIAMCQQIGAEPIIVINIGTHDSIDKRPDYIQEALDWIEYCNGSASSIWGSARAANGHPEPYNVKYWEIDNETWFQMDASTYSLAVQEFAQPMVAKDPNIKIIACGSGGLSSQAWNQTVIDMCAGIIDYISIHHYESPNLYQYGPIDFEEFIDRLGDIIADSNNPNIKIYASEWNAQSTDWRTGLYAGGLLNGFERKGDVFEIGGPALFLRHTSATGWDNAFINFDHTGWFPAPNYVVMKLWRDNYAPYRINVTGSAGDLNAIATKSADGSKIYFKVVNPTDQSVPVKLVISDTFEAGSVSLQLVAPDSLEARNTLDNPHAVRVEDHYASLNEQTIRFTMPRISAGVVRVSREQ